MRTDHRGGSNIPVRLRLGGSCVDILWVISGITMFTILTTYVRGIVTRLTTTREPPSRALLELL